MKKQYFKNFRKEGLPGGPNELIINSEGFILSENGQWEFPGLPTVIPSSDITMEDVPYPVLGISDTGDTQMMYPEEDYQFDGDMVYELPMAQKGYNVKPRKGSILLEGETEPSTHLMRREYIPNTGWVAFPSLFQNEDGTWVDMSKEEDWMNIYDEANRRGEVYNFGENKRKAIKFADKGSWKKDLGIKKQGGGDISIPDLTKPNWLDTLPNQYVGRGDLPPMEVNIGLPKYGKKRVLNLKDYTKQNTTSNRFPVVQNPFSRENKINLHLPENYGEEHRRLEANPYFGGINVEPDLNVYYGGVDADLNLLNKNNNILDLRGGLNTGLVTYPGGSEFTSVNPSIGLSFTRKFAPVSSKDSVQNIARNIIDYGSQTPEAWDKEIRDIEHQIGPPDKWTIDDYNLLQNKLNEYKKWRENTPKGKAVIDYHNEPNEYVVPLPSHLQTVPKKQKGGWLNNLPKAQKGNTGKQSANESWGLTQESQLSDLTKGLLNNILHRQAFAESSFNPKVISGDKTSRVGALGMTQIMPETLNEYINKTGDKNINILDPKDAVKVQKWYMQDLLNADFIHKPNQSEKVRMVKALGSYNWGRGNMSKFLGKQKKKGVDIYSDELSWVNDLPVETRDYVNKIVLGTNEKFNQEYKQNSSKYKDYYQKGGWLDKL